MIKLPIKDLAKKTICEGYLFISLTDSRRVPVLKPGLYLDEAFIKKHALSNTIFDFDPVTDVTVTERFVELFRELKYLRFEKDIRMKSLEFAEYFFECMEDKKHFLSFAIACFQELCVLPAEDLRAINEADVFLFRKSLYSAAFSTIIGVCNDFYDHSMLRDLYTLTFAMDIGLCSSNYTYFIAQACNQENQRPGRGLAWLRENGASPAEIELFLRHPKASYEYLHSKSQLLSNPDLAEIALYQHELTDGKGFPRGVAKGLVSRWEAVAILSDSLVEISDEYEFEREVIGYLSNFTGAKIRELPVVKAYRKLSMALGHLKAQKDTGT